MLLKARWMLWIRAGRSPVAMVLLPTYADKISGVISMTSDFSSMTPLSILPHLYELNLIPQIIGGVLIRDEPNPQDRFAILFSRIVLKMSSVELRQTA